MQNGLFRLLHFFVRLHSAVDNYTDSATDNWWCTELRITVRDSLRCFSTCCARKGHDKREWVDLAWTKVDRTLFRRNPLPPTKYTPCYRPPMSAD